MKQFLILGVLAVLLVGNVTEARRPNIIFILTDDQRYDAMGFMGAYPFLDTPNMDRIASEGVIFKNTYTANPVCVPARAVFLTGLSCVNVRVESNGDNGSEAGGKAYSQGLQPTRGAREKDSRGLPGRAHSRAAWFGKVHVRCVHSRFPQ